jgi:hypothetical protein
MWKKMTVIIFCWELGKKETNGFKQKAKCEFEKVYEVPH